MTTRNHVNRSRTLLEAFSSLFRGQTRGAANLEYITIVGACALTGIVGFKQFGVAFNSNLEEEAKHIQGKGMPDLGNPLKPTLPYVGSPLAPLVPAQPAFPACGPRGCTRPGECFAAGTLVATESGDRPIESIRVGEHVWSKDVESGELALKPVTELYVTARAPVIEIELDGENGVSERLTVTPRHRFWTQERGWAEARTLTSALLDSPTTQLSPTGFANLSATALAMSGELTTVYNLEVGDYHNYFVGRSHALVHNGAPTLEATLPCDDPAPKPNPTKPTEKEPRRVPELPPGDICAEYQEKLDKLANNPENHECPPGFTPGYRGAEKTRVCEVMPGTIGAYRELGAGAETENGYPIRVPAGYERDHIPQTEASWRSAQDLVGDRINASQGNLCKSANPECVRRVAYGILGDAKLGGTYSPEQGNNSTKPELTGWMRSLYLQVRNSGTTIVVPVDLHKAGNTNSRPPSQDRVDRLGIGAQADIQKYLAILRDKLASTPNMLNDCETAILKNALRAFEVKTNAEYEKELSDVIDRQLSDAIEKNGTSPIDDAVAQACAQC